MAITRANANNKPSTKKVIKKTEKSKKEVAPKKVVKKTTSKKSTAPAKEKSKYLVINETADRSYVGNQYFNKRLYNNFVKFGYDKADFSKPTIEKIKSLANLYDYTLREIFMEGHSFTNTSLGISYKLKIEGKRFTHLPNTGDDYYFGLRNVLKVNESFADNDVWMHTGVKDGDTFTDTDGNVIDTTSDEVAPIVINEIKLPDYNKITPVTEDKSDDDVEETEEEEVSDDVEDEIEDDSDEEVEDDEDDSSDYDEEDDDDEDYNFFSDDDDED